MTTHGVTMRSASYRVPLLAMWLWVLCLWTACGSTAGSGTPSPETDAGAADGGAGAADAVVGDAGGADAPAVDAAGADVTAADSGASGATPDGGGSAAVDASPVGGLTLTSPAFTDQGTMAAEFTCDGVGHSPPLAWSGVPSGTVELALLMTTQAKDGTKWNWVLYGIPPTASSLAVGQTDVGTFGLTSDGPNLAYAPPCSQGPGAKFYTFTVYALSAKPSLPASAKMVTGPVLTAAMQGITLASSSLSVSYTRPN